MSSESARSSENLSEIPNHRKPRVSMSQSNSKENINENTPIVTDVGNNYGTAGNNNHIASGVSSRHSSMRFTLYGQDKIEVLGHCHRERAEGVDVKARKQLITASVLCLVFMIAEIIGGVLSNSLAIATDAAHLLTDFASFMISLLAISLAGRPSTQRFSFGWYRAEVIGALVSVAMIWVITGILVWLAIHRIISGQYEVDAKIMLITSVLAIIVNIIMGVQLHQSGGHGHSHGHSHSANVISRNHSHITVGSAFDSVPESTILAITPESQQDGKIATTATSNGLTQHATSKEGKPKKKHFENMNVHAAFIHVLGDILQSAGVCLAALIIYFKPEWAIADPICTFVFSIIVLFTTFAILKEALLVLMEGTPTYLDYTEVMEIFLQIDGVERVHNLRIWALSLNKVALSAHLAIKPGSNPRKILQEATTAVHLKYNFFETTIQIEDFTPEMENCQQCTVPAS